MCDIKPFPNKNLIISAQPGSPPMKLEVSSLPVQTWDNMRMIMRPARRRVLAVLYHLFPQSVEFGAAGNKPAPWGQGNYKSMSYWSKSNKGTSCTSTNPNVMNTAAKSGQWAFNALNSPAWVAYTPGRLPSVGDTYILRSDLMGTEHVGIILHVPSSESDVWITADGGQKDPYRWQQSAVLNARRWVCKEAGKDKVRTPYLRPPIRDPSIKPEVAEPADGTSRELYFNGWVDLDQAPGAILQPDSTYTEEDYKALGALINSVRAQALRV